MEVKIDMRLAAAVLIASLAPAPAGAQSLTPASRELIRELKLPPDIMEGLDQELAVPAAWLEGAKKEGIVHVTMITDERDFDRLWKVFAARYPGIKYEYTRGVGQQRALQPLLAYRRGTYITDVVSSFQVLEAEYRKADSLLNIVSLLPAVKSTRPEFNSEAGIGVAYRLTNFCMAYASERVKKEELPKTWEELVASPRWRNGKVGMAANANSWMVELWGHKGEAWGRDYVRRIFTELRPQLRKENLTTIGRLAALGEYDIAIPVSDAAVNNLAKKGIAAGFHCPDVVPVAIQWVGVLKGNPHPNASLLFTNWLISKEGQIATHWADSLTPANRGLARKEFLPYPEQVLGKPAAPLAGSALRDMPQIMEYWISHWNKAGGPGGPGGEGAKAGKGGPR